VSYAMTYVSSGRRRRRKGKGKTHCFIPLRRFQRHSTIFQLPQPMLDIPLQHPSIPRPKERFLLKPLQRLLPTPPQVSPDQRSGDETFVAHRLRLRSRKKRVEEDEGGEEGWESGCGEGGRSATEGVTDADDVTRAVSASCGRGSPGNGLGGIGGGEGGRDVGSGEEDDWVRRRGGCGRECRKIEIGHQEVEEVPTVVCPVDWPAVSSSLARKGEGEKAKTHKHPREPPHSELPSRPD
jgi:hypothetical protein